MAGLWRCVPVVLLLAGAIYSGTATLRQQMKLQSEWRHASPLDRERYVYGPLLPVIHKINSQVREGEGILLRSGVDPALFPYVFFPRKIWQRQTDPETNYIYMDLPTSAFPLRATESFPAAWALNVQADNLAQGGELVRLKPAPDTP